MLLDWWDRSCTYLSERFNISKNKVSIILALAIIKLLSIVIILIVFLCWKSDSKEDSEPFSPNGTNDELILAQTICRHGARTPTWTYKNDPCASIKENWPEGLGELTNTGKQQHYELGQYFRKRYGKLLGNDDFLASNVYVRSTDYNRCLMSAAACMAGLFPPQGNNWNKDIHWQPVPIHTVPRPQDPLFYAWLSCKRFQNAWNEYTNSTEYKAFFEKHKSLINYLEEKSGVKLNTLHDLYMFYDRLNVGRSKDKCTPSWVDNIMQKNGDFEQIARYFFESQTATTQMKKLRAGFLLKEILDESRKIQGYQPIETPKLRLYFAHDSTIVDMLNSLGLYTRSFVPFASCIFFELYKNTTDYYFQVFYRNTTAINVPALTIPKANCGKKCPLDKWYSVYKDILPTKSYEAECAT